MGSPQTEDLSTCRRYLFRTLPLQRNQTHMLTNLMASKSFRAEDSSLTEYGPKPRPGRVRYPIDPIKLSSLLDAIVRSSTHKHQSVTGAPQGCITPQHTTLVAHLSPPPLRPRGLGLTRRVLSSAKRNTRSHLH